MSTVCAFPTKASDEFFGDAYGHRLSFAPLSPSLFPRAFATARAALVIFEIASPRAQLLSNCGQDMNHEAIAWGVSTATNSAPDSMTFEINARFAGEAIQLGLDPTTHGETVRVAGSLQPLTTRLQVLNALNQGYMIEVDAASAFS